MCEMRVAGDTRCLRPIVARGIWRVELGVKAGLARANTSRMV
jgi:hypothetical protein